MKIFHKKDALFVSKPEGTKVQHFLLKSDKVIDQ